MKKIALLIPMFALALSVLACSYGAKPVNKISYGPLPSQYSSYAGGYSAQVFTESWEKTEPQFWYWEVDEVGGFVDDCVEVGRYTQSIVLQNQSGYGWKQNGDWFCLVKK